jgi:hypothetical protein
MALSPSNSPLTIRLPNKFDYGAITERVMPNPSASSDGALSQDRATLLQSKPERQTLHQALADPSNVP